MNVSKEMLTRPRCVLLGCCVEQDIPCCHFCGADIYENFIESGRLYPLFLLYWRTCRFIRELSPITRCQECGKRIVLGRPYTKDFCSEECRDNWLPF